MRQILFLRICILFLTFFFFSCKDQSFFKRKYTDGFFIGGISKKQKTICRNSYKADSVGYVVKKTSNNFLVKGDSDIFMQSISVYPHEVDFRINHSVGHQKNYHEVNRKSIVQNSREISYIETQRPNSFNFKSIGTISLIGGSLISLGLFGRKKNAKRISKWAYRNKWKTRLLIFGATVSNICVSILIGDLVRQNNVVLPNHLMEYAASAFGLTLLMYPKKENVLFDKKTYIKRKLAHLSLASLSCIMTIISSYEQRPCVTFVKHVIPEVLSSNPTSKSLNDNQILQPKVELSKSFITKPVEENTMKWWQKLTIFFIILTAIASTLAIMVLSCYLSCSGQGGAATLLGVGGTALLIALTIYSIVKIRQIKIEPKKPKTDSK